MIIIIPQLNSVDNMMIDGCQKLQPLLNSRKGLGYGWDVCCLATLSSLGLEKIKKVSHEFGIHCWTKCMKRTMLASILKKIFVFEN